MRLELDISNTFIHGRALELVLGRTLSSQLAFKVSITPPLRAFLAQRHHLDGLVTSAATHKFTSKSKDDADSYDEAAQALISTLFGTNAAIPCLNTRAAVTPHIETIQSSVQLPTLHALGYLYEAGTAVLRSYAPFLSWISSAAPNCSQTDDNLTCIQRLLQSVAAKPVSQDDDSNLVAVCSKLEQDYILNEPLAGID